MRVLKTYVDDAIYDRLVADAASQGLPIYKLLNLIVAAHYNGKNAIAYFDSVKILTRDIR